MVSMSIVIVSNNIYTLFSLSKITFKFKIVSNIGDASIYHKKSFDLVTGFFLNDCNFLLRFLFD